MDTLLASYVLPVTEALVEDTLIELNLVLRYYDYNGTYRIKLHIPLPDNYPHTPLAENYLINQVGLFEADLSIMGNQSTWLPSFEKIQYILNRPAKYGIILHGFYIIPKRDLLSLTWDEQLLVKGLGKKALCIGTDHIITLLNMEASKTIILLEASGGKIATEADELAVQNYMRWSHMDLLDLYKRRYYDDYLSYQPQDMDVEFLAETLVTTPKNKFLIEYYKSALGFISLNRVVNGRHMGVFVDTFLDHCY